MPRDSPLAVRVGVGEVTIRSGGEDLAVKMGIGDLTIHSPKEAVASVAMSTRIGDASVSERGAYTAGRRRMLIGAKLKWREGEGRSTIDVGLKIGDAQVILE